VEVWFPLEWLVCWTWGLARFVTCTLCCWTRHLTLRVPLFTHKWVLANLLRRATLQWTTWSILSMFGFICLGGHRAGIIPDITIMCMWTLKECRIVKLSLHKDIKHKFYSCWLTSQVSEHEPPLEQGPCYWRKVYICVLFSLKAGINIHVSGLTFWRS